MLLLHLSISSQDTDRKITFPDVPGYKTLKCDLHIHTVFSDGLVWPTIRVDEAVADGLDAISLTEHIEYQPHKEDIPHPDRNRSYEIARQAAIAHDLIVIHGTEITRDMPPGHANALFVTDVNAIIKDDAKDAYRAARDQGAFIFWNHPNWMAQQKDGIPVLSDFHEDLIQSDLLHGIEVVNDITYSQEALQIALDNNLTVMGTSDIHGLIDYQFNLLGGGHRPICLVFATERSEAGIKEALFAGRTVTWFEDVLTGKEAHLSALIQASIEVTNKGYIGDTEILQIELTNKSDAVLYLKNSSAYDFYAHGDMIILEGQGTTMLQVLTAKGNVDEMPLTFEVINAIVGPKKYVTFSISLD